MEGRRPAVPLPPAAVLVKIAPDGLYGCVDLDGLLSMNRLQLLVALSSHAGFAHELAGVPLSKCTVRVCASASNKAPTEAELRAEAELGGAQALGALAVELPCSPGGRTYLYLDVSPPQQPAAAVAAAGAAAAGRPSADAVSDVGE